MSKVFNTSGACNPEIHYMVDLSKRLNEIKNMVDDGQYFTINRARQYGKTTLLKALGQFLKNEYLVIQLDFQRFGYADFESEYNFVEAFTAELLECDIVFPQDIYADLNSFANGDPNKWKLRKLFRILSHWCCISEQKIILMIDEVDSATNNQVFLDFLAQLRSYYLDRDKLPTFQSVILAGVYDVKNIKRKLRPEDMHKTNSPWNIAADFDVVMSFSQNEIEEMLREYETDRHMGIDLNEISELIYSYTSGYPYLVSRICKLIDEKVAGSNDYKAKTASWTKQGFLEAIRLLLSEKNTLFESLIGKLNDYSDLQKMIYDILFGGKRIVYNPDNTAIDIAAMFGFAKNSEGNLVLTNKIFEMRLHNYFLTTSAAQSSKLFWAASDNKSQFICNGHLNMDVVVDYLGERFVIELKIWRGTAYNERGERQLSDYLDYFNIKKGYMLSYNFNQKKKIGIKEIHLGDKVLVEAVV